MKAFVYLSFLALIFQCRVTDSQSDTFVVKLTTDTFDSFIREHDFVLVKFYAAWWFLFFLAILLCTHYVYNKNSVTYSPLVSHRFSLSYLFNLRTIISDVFLVPAKHQLVHFAYQEESSSIVLAEVDGSEEQELSHRFNLASFPKLSIFKAGIEYEYEGPHDSAGIASAVQKWRPPANRVVSLTTDNFDEWINNQALAVVKFFAPWCGHCKRLAPHFTKAARILQTHSTPIGFAEVNADEEKELGSRFEISGYPTLKVFRHSKLAPYDGPLSSGQKIADYMTKLVLPPSRLLLSQASMEAFFDKEMGVIGFFSEKSSTLQEVFQDVALTHRDIYRFGHTLSPALRAHFGIDHEAVILHHPTLIPSQFEPQRIVFQGNATADALIGFIEEHRLPLVGFRNTQNRNWFSKPMLVAYLDVDLQPGDGLRETLYWRERLCDVAARFKKQLSFAISDAQDFRPELVDLQLHDTDDDVVFAIFSSDHKYALRIPLTVRSIVQSVEKFLDGKLQPFFKSQSIPKKQTAPVITVVGKTFQQVVMDSAKDVFIALTAPWCRHCKALYPKLKKLATRVSGQNILIATLDATANDIPVEGFVSNGYPTIYFVSASGMQIKYDGKPQVIAMLKFLKEHASQPF